MNNNLPLSQDKKLAVVFRVESGCLGPEGASHVDDFCNFAQKEFEPSDSDFIHWVIVPRNDKSLPEMQYQINNKNLSRDKAAKYLELFQKNISEFEGDLDKKIALLIDQFFGR